MKKLRLDGVARWRLWIGFLVLGVLVMGCRRSKVEVGLAVGDAAPDFRLQNQTGESVTLEQLLARKKYLALIFYRSADW